MWTGKCRCMCLGPFSLGFSLGILSGLATLILSLWAMKYGLPTNIATQMGMVTPTNMTTVWFETLWSLITGFFFGFFLAILYNIFACCFGMFRKKGEGCECGCGGSCKCSRSDVRVGSQSTFGTSSRDRDTTKV